MFDIIVAEGSEAECAFYTVLMIESFRLKHEHDKKQEVKEWLAKYGDKTFDDLMKMERDEGE